MRIVLMVVALVHAQSVLALPTLTLEPGNEPVKLTPGQSVEVQCREPHPLADWCLLRTPGNNRVPFQIIYAKTKESASGQTFQTLGEARELYETLKAIGQCKYQRPFAESDVTIELNADPITLTPLEPVNLQCRETSPHAKWCALKPSDTDTHPFKIVFVDTNDYATGNHPFHYIPHYRLGDAKEILSLMTEMGQCK